MELLLSQNFWAIYLIGAVIILTGIGCLIYKISRKIKIKRTGIEEIKNVRYTAEDDITKNGDETNISYNRTDLLLPMGVDELVGVNCKVKPGKYTILCTLENQDKINVRLGHYVREYSHGTEIVLAEGEKITPVSSAIILR